VPYSLTKIVKMSAVQKMSYIVVILILHQLAGISSNVHDHNHHHGHGEHDAHHHHESDGSGDCELDDSLADLIKNFGLSVLGKDQESADDVQPTEDHNHINIKALIDELFHPSTTQRSTTSTTQKVTSTERLPIKSHDFGWDKSPIDLVMSNHLLEPVFGPEDKERHSRNFGATTQSPVYLTETHYYFPGDFSESHKKESFSPIQENRQAKSINLDLNLDVSQLIDKPTIPVVDTRLANFLLVNGGRRPKSLPAKSKQHINNNSDRTNAPISLDNPLLFKQPTTPPFLIKFVDAPRKNNSPSEFSRSKSSSSLTSKGHISKRIQAPSTASQLNRPITNSVGSSHSKLAQPQPRLPPTTTSPASAPRSGFRPSSVLHTALTQVKHDVQLHAGKQSPTRATHKSSKVSHRPRKTKPRKSSRRQKHRPGNPSSLQESGPSLRRQKSQNLSESKGSKHKGMVGFNGLDMMRMKEDKFECLDKDEGLHADVSSGCQRFYMCHENGRSGRFSCPIGTLFNNLLGVCDWAGKVDCLGSNL